jgi:pyruvate dehydrogenase E1 component alpha subunit
MLGADGIVGGGIPIAAGAALGMRLKGIPSVVFCFFGDGASNQGSFHEALNFAAVNRLAVVFICENNLWALSTSFKETTAGGSVANRAAAYGMPGERIDGNDVEVVFATATAAAARAAKGDGPSLIECVSYRWEPHSIFTRRETRPQQEIEDWKQKDPIARYGRHLVDNKNATSEELLQIESEVQAEVTKASAFATSSAIPIPESAGEDVFA